MAGKNPFPTQLSFLDSPSDLHHKRGETDKRQIAVSEHRVLWGMGFSYCVFPSLKPSLKRIATSSFNFVV